MSLPKIFLILSVGLFAAIGAMALSKRQTPVRAISAPVEVTTRQNIDLHMLARPEKPVPEPKKPVEIKPPIHVRPVPPPSTEESEVVIEHETESEGLSTLFAKNSSCPIVESIPYRSHVSWKKKGAAWLSDYASHYKTPIGFIFSSIHGRPDVTPKDISDGTMIRVLKKDVHFRFHIVVSLSTCRARLYYVLPDERKVVFLKSYQCGLGRADSSHASGFLTPTGLYELGFRVASFRPRMMGPYKGNTVELMQIFGNHWIPFEKEVSACSEPAKGLGIHGMPMKRKGNELVEDTSSLGHHESDGCIRLTAKDMSEIFSVISTRKTFVEIVPSFQQSKLLRGEIE